MSGRILANVNNCPQLMVLNIFMDRALKYNINDIIIVKLNKVRNRICNYYINTDLNHNINTDYPSFLFDVGMVTGILNYYTGSNSLRPDYIEDLNKIYKKYKGYKNES